MINGKDEIYIYSSEAGVPVLRYTVYYLVEVVIKILFVLFVLKKTEFGFVRKGTP